MCHLILSKRLPRKITYSLYLYTIFICIFLAPFSGQYGIPIFLLGAIIILSFHKKDRLYNLLFFQILWAWSVLTDYAVTIPLRIAGYDFDVILTSLPLTLLFSILHALLCILPCPFIGNRLHRKLVTNQDVIPPRIQRLLFLEVTICSCIFLINIIFGSLLHYPTDILLFNGILIFCFAAANVLIFLMLYNTLQANKKQYNSLNAQIDKLIQQQIAEERRRREEARKRELERQRRLAAANKKKSRSSKSKSSSKRSSERSSEEKREQMAVFEMEKADRALSNNFASNRGRLPVPITGSYMITTHYGQYTPDGLKGVQLDSKGISITGKSGARARAIFDGEVSAVFSFGGMTNVLVRHGSYISVYCNLSSSSVRKGQKVSTRDIIGPIARDASGNCTMHFQLRKETSKLNPESWLNL